MSKEKAIAIAEAVEVVRKPKYKFTYLELPPNEIQKTPYNPDVRTDAKRLKALKESMEKFGCNFQDVLIFQGKDGKFVMIDGNRRNEIAKQLEWEMISCKWVIPLDETISMEEIFRDLNSTPFKLNGTQYSDIYSKGVRGAIPKRVLEKFDSLVEYGEQDSVPALNKLGLTVSTVDRTINLVSKFLEDDTIAGKKVVLNYILTKKKPTILRDNFKKFDKAELKRKLEAVEDLQ